MRRPVLWAIRGYQQTLSRALPPACRFVPSCSEYAYEAIERYGLAQGGRLAAWRVLRCNPWGGYGYDPVPDRVAPMDHASRDLSLPGGLSVSSAAPPGDSSVQPPPREG